MELDFKIGVKARDRFRLHSHRGDNWTVGSDKNTKEESIGKEGKKREEKSQRANHGENFAWELKKGKRDQAGGREQVAPETGESQEGQLHRENSRWPE